MIEERVESLLTGDFRSDEVFWSNMRCGKVNRSSKISKMHLYMDLYIVRILYLAGVTTRGLAKVTAGTLVCALNLNFLIFDVR